MIIVHAKETRALILNAAHLNRVAFCDDIWGTVQRQGIFGVDIFAVNTEFGLVLLLNDRSGNSVFGLKTHWRGGAAKSLAANISRAIYRRRFCGARPENNESVLTKLTTTSIHAQEAGTSRCYRLATQVKCNQHDKVQQVDTTSTVEQHLIGAQWLKYKESHVGTECRNL